MNPPSTVVVTRPAPDHEPLCQALGARGMTAIHSPAVERVAEPSAVRRRRLGDLERFDRVIVVSPFAARLIADAVDPGRYAETVFAAPGPGTGRLLEQAGLIAAWPERGGTSEDLLGIRALASVRDRRICIVGAPGGRRLLDRELRRRGARVERVDLYQRRPCRPAESLLRALDAGVPLIVLISSTGAVDAIEAGLDERRRARLGEAVFVVSSERVARRCRDAGAGVIVPAEGASDAAMLEAVERHRRC